MVPVRINVEKTSAGTVTSAAPLSIVNSSVIAPLISTGKTNAPPTFFNGVSAREGDSRLGAVVGAVLYGALNPESLRKNACVYGLRDGLRRSARHLDRAKRKPPREEA
jgi:hypothetical protein